MTSVESLYKGEEVHSVLINRHKRAVESGLRYLQQTAEGSTDVSLGSLMALTLHLVHGFHKLLQNLHSKNHHKNVLIDS